MPSMVELNMKAEQTEAELAAVHLLNSSRLFINTSPALSASMRDRAFSLDPNHLPQHSLTLTLCDRCGSSVRTRVNGKRQKLSRVCQHPGCGHRHSIVVGLVNDLEDSITFSSDLNVQERSDRNQLDILDDDDDQISNPSSHLQLPLPKSISDLSSLTVHSTIAQPKNSNPSSSTQIPEIVKSSPLSGKSGKLKRNKNKQTSLAQILLARRQAEESKQGSNGTFQLEAFFTQL
ncbi:hypothetical protein CROQUDRAFT_651299 [Cronartium quercuum f. sp. fusiforme G11]|uniref:Uncharacterized protein n=1 Tax=Cronartium quercuum f. sp. fusiforme G11 TaxID=708437 RepID=A0A9P6NSK2_9BASI|nr:hypothetical protein CROQUDRAFT_651299 [Cronartium quercuum f. sp. fusiforme G11]